MDAATFTDRYLALIPVRLRELFLFDLASRNLLCSSFEKRMEASKHMTNLCAALERSSSRSHFICREAMLQHLLPVVTQMCSLSRESLYAHRLLVAGFVRRHDADIDATRVSQSVVSLIAFFYDGCTASLMARRLTNVLKCVAFNNALTASYIEPLWALVEFLSELNAQEAFSRPIDVRELCTFLSVVHSIQRHLQPDALSRLASGISALDASLINRDFLDALPLSLKPVFELKVLMANISVQQVSDLCEVVQKRRLLTVEFLAKKQQLQVFWRLIETLTHGELKGRNKALSSLFSAIVALKGHLKQKQVAWLSARIIDLHMAAMTAEYLALIPETLRFLFLISIATRQLRSAQLQDREAAASMMSDLCARTDGRSVFVNAKRLCKMIDNEKVLSALLAPSDETSIDRSNAAVMLHSDNVLEFLVRQGKLKKAHFAVVWAAVECVAGITDPTYAAARRQELLLLIRMLSNLATHLDQLLASHMPRLIELWKGEYEHQETTQAIGRLFRFLADEGKLTLQHIASLWDASGTTECALFAQLLPFLDFDQITFVMTSILELQADAVVGEHLGLLTKAVDIIGDVERSKQILTFSWNLIMNEHVELSVQTRALLEMRLLLNKNWLVQAGIEADFAEHLQQAEAKIADIE